MSEDYSEYTTSQSDDALARFGRLSTELEEAEQEVLRCEQALKKAQEKVADLAERQIPELAEELDLEEFKTSSGLKLKVEEVIRASIPKKVQPQAFRWLRDNGAASLIKRQVSVEFGKGQDEQAQALMRELLPRFPEVLNDKTSVHPSTLSSTVRQWLEEGRDIPLDLLGVHRQRRAKLLRK